MKDTARLLIVPSLLSMVLVALFLSEYYGAWSWLSSGNRRSVGAVVLGVTYLVVLLVVVVLERPWPSRQGRHRWDTSGPAGAAAGGVSRAASR